jgi:hypothetical protein
MPALRAARGVTLFRRWGPARTRGERIMRLLIACAAAALVAVLATIGAFDVAVATGMVRPKIASPLAGDLRDATSDRHGLRVLILGNSITFEHENDQLLTRLAASGPANEPVFAVRFAPGGWRLTQHAAEPEVAKLLREVRWDVVVLQEESEVAAYPPQWRARFMDPAVRALVARIRADGARPLLVLDAGYRSGDTYHFTTDSYDAMQARAIRNARALASAFRLQVAPVGIAYKRVRTERPELALWEADGIHPTLDGSYLAACVLYDVLFHRPPASDYAAGLAADDAAFLQRAAAEAVRGL